MKDTLCTFAGGALQVELSPLLVVLLQRFLRLLHVLLRLLGRFSGLTCHTLGCHLHLNHSVLECRLLGWWRVVAHVGFYI